MNFDSIFPQKDKKCKNKMLQDLILSLKKKEKKIKILLNKITI